jgi:hypothetical protein
MKKGDLVRDLRSGCVGLVTDAYLQPQINKLFVKIYAAGRETCWIREDEVEPVQEDLQEIE